MSSDNAVQPYSASHELATPVVRYAEFQSPRQLITRAVWNSVATFASVAGQGVRLAAPVQEEAVARLPASTTGASLVCETGMALRARRSFAGVAIPKRRSAT